MGLEGQEGGNGSRHQLVTPSIGDPEGEKITGQELGMDIQEKSR